MNDSTTPNAATSALVASLSDAVHGMRDLHTVIVYGSGAAGTMRSGGDSPSDVDVAVASDHPLPLERKLELIARLGEAVRRDVDLVDLSTVHGLLLVEILTKGVAVRADRPEFLAEKAIEMYDSRMFLEPAIRKAREFRIRRLVGGSDGPRTG